MAQEGLHLIVFPGPDTSENAGQHTVELLNELMGWRLESAGVWTELGSTHAESRLRSCQGFGDGPQSLECRLRTWPHGLERAAAIQMASLALPPVDGLYSANETLTDDGYSYGGVVAWTSPQGRGRVTYLGFLYSRTLVSSSTWTDLLHSLLANTCNDIMVTSPVSICANTTWGAGSHSLSVAWSLLGRRSPANTKLP